MCLLTPLDSLSTASNTHKKWLCNNHIMCEKNKNKKRKKKNLKNHPLVEVFYVVILDATIMPTSSPIIISLNDGKRNAIQV